MDETAFKEFAKRLKSASKVIEELDPVLREDAWAMLRPFVSPDEEPTHEKHGDQKRQGRDGSVRSKSGVSEDVLIEEHESDKESDNLYLTLAILYQRHGRGPF